MFKIIFFETGLIPIEKKQKLLSLAQVSRILILTVFACSKTHVFRPRFEGKMSKPQNGHLKNQNCQKVPFRSLLCSESAQNGLIWAQNPCLCVYFNHKCP